MILRWLQIWSASQITNEIGDCGESSIAERVKFGRRFGIPMLSRYTVVQMINELDQRTSSDHEELRKLPVSVAAESFGDISSDRAGCITNLIAESEVIRDRTTGSYLVHLVTKLIRQLPHHQFLKASSSHANAGGTFHVHAPSSIPHDPSTPAPQHLAPKHLCGASAGFR
jgi:hypothetical protein